MVLLRNLIETLYSDLKSARGIFNYNGNIYTIPILLGKKFTYKNSVYYEIRKVDLSKKLEFPPHNTQVRKKIILINSLYFASLNSDGDIVIIPKTLELVKSNILYNIKLVYGKFPQPGMLIKLSHFSTPNDFGNDLDFIEDEISDIELLKLKNDYDLDKLTNKNGYIINIYWKEPEYKIESWEIDLHCKVLIKNDINMNSESEYIIVESIYDLDEEEFLIYR